MKQLMTQWGEELLKEKREDVHQEYPRPQMVRDSYLNLNGFWDYAFSCHKKRPEEYEGQILVPFSPETLLSGVERQLGPHEFLHYRKLFTLPEDFIKNRVLLHFEAVDQDCIVYMNGQKLGSHRGGYLRFSFDVTEALCEGENELTLVVRDQTEQSPHARGKQKLVKKGMMSYLYYTAQSGIWKTVWMESVPERYISEMRIKPLYDEARVQISLLMNSGETIERSESVPDFRAWSPEDPYLYDLEIREGEDLIKTYFGMRKIEIKPDEKGILRIFLNDKAYFMKGVLDQGYWPESLMTPPCEEALLYDIRQIKALGFNTLRKHVKVESERFYYLCDREGVIVWQDMPNGGGEYDHTFVTYIPNFIEKFRHMVKDNNYARMKRGDAKGREQYDKDLRGMVKQLANFPCIAAWVPFNEGWGQFDANKATALIKSLDDTRLVNEACGWFDQGGGDIYAIHNYALKLSVKAQKDRCVVLTEFGGYACVVEGHVACDRRFGYKSYKSLNELNESYKKLLKGHVIDNIADGLSGAIYTQVSDIEEETNGLMTYDRKVLKIREMIRAGY